MRVCLRACVRNLVLNPWAHSSWVILMILIKDLDILSRVNILWIRLMLIISKKLVIGSCWRRSRLNYSIILLAISYCLMIIWYKCILGIFGNQVGISCCSHGAIDILWPLLDIYKISVYCLRAIDLVLIIYRTLVVLKNLRIYMSGIIYIIAMKRVDRGRVNIIIFGRVMTKQIICWIPVKIIGYNGRIIYFFWVHSKIKFIYK